MLTASRVRERVYLTSPYSLKEEVKAIPGGRWDKAKTAWSYPATPAVAESIARLAKEQRCELTTDGGFDHLLEQAREAFRSRRNRDRTDLPDLPTSTEAWTHQRQAYHFALGQPAAMLAMDMGTGKSLTAIGLMEGWEASRVLIVCPTSVVGVWPREFAKHAARPWRVIAPKGTIAKRTEAYELALATATPTSPVACVVNYEAAWRDPFAAWALRQPWDVAVCDESHRIKAPGGKQALWAQKLGHVAKRRLALTGTPLAHGPLDVYAQYRFLDEGVFGTSYSRFRQRYAVMGGYGGYQVQGYQREAELAERMGRLAFQCKAGEVLDLPGERDTDRRVTLGKPASKAYKDLWDDYVTEVGDGDARGEVIALNALSQMLRVQQVTSGHLPVQDDPDDPDTKRVVLVGTEKRDLLEDYLRDLPVPNDERGLPVHGGDPVVVFCRFTHDLRAVRDVAIALGRTYGEISGASKDALAGDATMAPGLDVVGVQISSGGVGIDLTRARYGVYYSLGFSLTDYVQSRARLHRPGQDRPVLFAHLIAELADGSSTIDAVVYRALSARQDVVEAVLAAARGGAPEPPGAVEIRAQQDDAVALAKAFTGL